MTDHIQEEQLILHYYGEAEISAAALERHLANCGDCRTRYQQVVRVLNSVEPEAIPERGAGYGGQVWEKLPASIKSRPSGRWFASRRWVPSAVMAALLAVAFLTGRHWPRETPQPVAAGQGQVRERILLVAVGDHLERSQMVLVELANSPASDLFNIALERSLAENLVEANRLYRQTAAATGNAPLADVLDDLERVLIEIVHSPETISRRQLEEIQHRIEERGLLFKVRVLGSQIRGRESTATREKNATKL
ncbi:MAG TPA: hypothetical protein VMZ52_05995 [Bryobacteraceae bacterium]|nr:hypothetical protein [Bryobacteraceae bacterium]